MATEEKPKTYSDEEVEAKIAEHGLDGWYLEDGWLRRKYNTDGWPSTLMAVNAVRYRCEAADHPAGFAVARQIEDTVLWRPPDDSPLEGTPNKFVFSKGTR